MKTVAKCRDIQEAELLESRLESAGIPAFVPDTLSWYDGLLMYMGGIRVQGSDEHAERQDKYCRPVTTRVIRSNNSLQTHSTAMTFRPATIDDCSLLAELNHQLIRDEGHRNRMTVAELEQRMRGWLSSEYRAVIYEDSGEVVAYALFREQPQEIYLRQLFVVRHRRSQGLGRHAVEILRSQVWPKTKRLTVDVLVANKRGVAFWREVGYTDYCLSLEILPDDSTCA